eukprot:COSAG02_NODE_51071_length_316_cov_1.152074_1_plen_62_part_10
MNLIRRMCQIALAAGGACGVQRDGDARERTRSFTVQTVRHNLQDLGAASGTGADRASNSARR